MEFLSALFRPFRVGIILKVPVYLDITLLPGIFFFSQIFSRSFSGQPVERFFWGLLSAALLYSSVLAHEFAHVLTARRFEIQAYKIILHFFGGEATLTSLGRTPSQALLIALVGPAMSAVIAINTFGVLALFPGIWASNRGQIFYGLGLINLSLAVFNLLPVLPLDGGRVSVALIWKTRHQTSPKGYFYAVLDATTYISLPIFVVALVGYTLANGIHLYTLLLGALIGLMLFKEYRNAKSETDVIDSPSEQL